MPRADWGISAADVDEFDRSSQYAPYTGPTPPNGVKLWRVKILRFASATRESPARLRYGLELVPRDDSEKRYEGYWIFRSQSITPKSNMFWVPVLDALSNGRISGEDFENRTIYDQEGNIQKIGSWRNTGDIHILAELKDGEDASGNPSKQLGWFGAVPKNYSWDGGLDDREDDDEWVDEEEPAPKSRQNRTRSTANARQGTTRNASSRRHARDEEDDFS